MGHTTGPWHANGDCIEAGGPGGPRDVTVAVATAAPSGSDIASNARLIAAAPELLAALKLLRDPDGDGLWPCYCDDPYFYGGKCENCIATAAIDKAEGRNE